MSVLAKTRQLQSAEGRQWRITGSTIFDVEYQGRSARVEVLILPSLEDEIVLSLTTLRDLLSGPIYGNQFPTPNAKVRRNNNLEPESSHHHVNTTRLAGTPPSQTSTRRTNHAQVVEKMNSPTIEKTAPIKTRYVTITADWVISERSAER
jgi:hypothetical protein